MNKPQTEGRVNHVCTEEHRRRSSTLFSNKKNIEAQLIVYLKSFLHISMVELIIKGQQQTHRLIIMGLDIFVLFKIFNYCRFTSYFEFAFHCFISF